MEPFELRKVRDFGELIHDTFVFVKLCWKPLLKAYYTVAGILVLAQIVLGVLYNLKMSAVLTTSARGGVTDPFQIFGPEYYLMILISVVNVIIVGLITYCFIDLYLQKGHIAPTPEEVWSFVKFYFFRFAGSYILLGILLVAGCFACFFPGIWLWPIVSLMMAAMIFENGSLGYSFNRGFRLVSDNWWTTFGALFIIYLVTYAAWMAIVMPSSVISMSSIFLGKAPKISIPLAILNSILTGLCGVFLILPTVVTALSYFSLTEMKDGEGLISRINMLGKNNPDKDLPSEEY